MSVALRPTPPLISLASAAEVHSEAADHTDPSSKVGSSPGVAEKRILGVLSLRTSDDDYEQLCCVCGSPQMVGIWVIRPSPSRGSMYHQTRTCGARAIRPPASPCAATRCGLRHAACGPGEAILGSLMDGLCTLLQATFGENPSTHSAE
jgi:hypothetical protein